MEQMLRKSGFLHVQLCRFMSMITDSLSWEKQMIAHAIIESPVFRDILSDDIDQVDAATFEQAEVIAIGKQIRFRRPTSFVIGASFSADLTDAPKGNLSEKQVGVIKAPFLEMPFTLTFKGVRQDPLAFPPCKKLLIYSGPGGFFLFGLVNENELADLAMDIKTKLELLMKRLGCLQK
jgi:hypothetical protein